ncbi:MAG: MarR family winged helix-turn-helix transcriptional regulator [Lachnospiraceae bacterium]
MDFTAKDITDITDINDNLDEKVDIVFRHQVLMTAYQSIPREYSPGFFMSEVEIHILGFICRNPGITAKDICRKTYRSKGTISSILSHLEEDGFIRQEVNAENQRERNLFLTDKGLYVHERHTDYDRRTTYDYILKASEFCTAEEINGFFKVTNFRNEYFEKVLEEERKKYAAYKKAQKKTGEKSN